MRLCPYKWIDFMIGEGFYYGESENVVNVGSLALSVCSLTLLLSSLQLFSKKMLTRYRLLSLDFLPSRTARNKSLFLMMNYT